MTAELCQEENVESFSITCTTCQTRLRVRDRSAVGQILTCPKCGSMVLVELPNGTASTATPPAENTTSEASRPVSGTSAASPALAVARGVESSVSESSDNQRNLDFSDTVEDLTKYGTVDAAPARREFKLSSPPVRAVPQHDEMDDDDEDDWRDDSDGPAAHRRGAYGAMLRHRWMLGSLAGVIGVTLAVGLLAWMAGGTASVSVQDQSSDGQSPVHVVERPELPDEAPSIADTTTGEEESPLDRIPIGNPPGTDLSQNDVEPARLPAIVETPKVNAAQVSPATQDTVLPPLTSSTPPGFESSDVAAKGERISGSGSLAETMRKLGAMFDASSPPVESDPLPAPSVPEVTETPPAVEPPRLTRPAPRNVDVSARLTDPIPEIEFSEIPLLAFLQFVTNYSTIPVTLEPEALMWLKLKPVAPVSAKQSNTTVGKLLDEVLGQLGLSYEPIEQGLVVHYRKSPDRSKRKVTLNVADLLTEGQTDAQIIKEHIQQLIAPGTWDGGALSVDNATLIVESTDEILFQVITFCEKLRVARGLNLRSKFDPQHFQVESRSARAKPLLSKSVTLNYSRPTSFVKIADRLSKETGLNLLVDWRALASAGWNPDAMVTLTVMEKTAAEALDTLLRPMELAYRVVDNTTVQITSAAAVDDRLEFEVYRLPVAINPGSEWKGQLNSLFSRLPSDWLRNAGGAGEIRFDSPSQCLLVALSQPRQQAFEKLLAKPDADTKPEVHEPEPPAK